MKAKVIKLEPNKFLNQYGGYLGILTYNHKYILEPVKQGTKVTIHEEYKGVYVPFWDYSNMSSSYVREEIMNFINFANTWSASEVLQGKIMLGLGIALLPTLFFIWRSQHLLLKGMLPPLVLLLSVLIGYGSYIIKSRPLHVKNSLSKFENSRIEAIKLEKEKHINDNKAGKKLITYVYPAMIAFGLIAVIFLSSFYWKGMALGFILLAVSTYIIDYGFVSRSDAFIEFLSSIS